MTPFDVAQQHFGAALHQAKDEGLDTDAMARHMLALVVSQYLQTRSSADVSQELRYVADNCGPGTGFAFKRS